MTDGRYGDGGAVAAWVEDSLMGCPETYGLGDGSGGERLFRIWPDTLGKLFLVGRAVRRLGLRPGVMSRLAGEECLRAVRARRGDAAMVLALYDCRTMEEHFDSERLDSSVAYISANMEDADMAALLQRVLTRGGGVEAAERFYGLDVDAENRRRVARAKGAGGSSVSFGGRSLYGTLVSHFVAKGMGVRQIVWEEGYGNLRMLMADEPASVWLSSEERRRVHLKGRPGEVIRADDPRNARRVAELLGGGGR